MRRGRGREERRERKERTEMNEVCHGLRRVREQEREFRLQLGWTTEWAFITWRRRVRVIIIVHE